MPVLERCSSFWIDDGVDYVCLGHVPNGEDGGGDGISCGTMLRAHRVGGEEIGHLSLHAMPCGVAMLRTDVRPIAPSLRRPRICILHF